MPANTAVPGLPRSRSERNSSDGLATSRRPSAGHFEHADLVGRAEAVLHRAQDAELLRAFALERQHGVDHVLDHARAGDLAVLGDMADQDDRRPGALGEADQSPAPSRAPASPCRARTSTVWVHMVWIESMTRSRGTVAFRQRRDDVLDRGFGGKFDRRVGKAEPLGAQPHLRHRFFAGDVDRAMARAAQTPRRLRSAASTCRCRDRRRPAAPSRAQSRRR